MQNKIIKVAQIGYGYWGDNLLRNLSDLPDVEVVAVCDKDSSKLERIAGHKRYKEIKTTVNSDDIIKDPTIDAIVVATPTQTHYVIASRCLDEGKSVLVEKPLTYYPEESLALIRKAEVAKSTLMVGHVFLYNNILLSLRDKVAPGTIRYMNSQRTGLGPIRLDCNVMWDLAPHDISMFNYLTRQKPVSVYADGRTFVQYDKGLEDVVFVNLEYPNGIIGHVTTSWIDPIKTRKITVVTSDKMHVFDDVAQTLTTFNKGIDYQPKSGEYGDFQLSVKDGDIIQPKIVLNEPLKEECKHFIDCVRSKDRPFTEGNRFSAHHTDGKNGYEVVCVLDAAQRSLRNGRRETIKYDM